MTAQNKRNDCAAALASLPGPLLHPAGEAEEGSVSSERSAPPAAR